MPTPKPFSRYPNIYHSYIRRGFLYGVEILCPSSKEASKLRKDLYNFRLMLIIESRLKPGLAELRSKADALKFSISGRKLFIVPKYRPVDENFIERLSHDNT